jgi:hypothetical protein
MTHVMLGIKVGKTFNEYKLRRKSILSLVACLRHSDMAVDFLD